jgi:protein gp37
MGEITKIQWCDHTFNPWIGCAKVDEGCKNCYAETLMDKRYGRVKWGAGNPRSLTSESNWQQPLRWNKAGYGRVFCSSLADWLDDEVPIEWLARLLALIYKTPNLTWLLLTKRPHNFKERIEAAFDFTHGEGWQSLWLQGDAPANVWVGSSVSSEDSSGKLRYLQEIPAAKRFVSYEPATGEFCAEEHSWIDWVIVGGESGPGARPFNPDWAKWTIDDCRAIGAAPFVKQMGSVWAEANNAKDKKGGDPLEWPEYLRVRDFPV